VWINIRSLVCMLKGFQQGGEKSATRLPLGCNHRLTGGSVMKAREGHLAATRHAGVGLQVQGTSAYFHFNVQTAVL
jgi:hypothetical protein